MDLSPKPLGRASGPGTCKAVEVNLVLRPNRPLIALETMSWWPLWLLFAHVAAFFLSHGAWMEWVLAWILSIGAFACVVAWVKTAPESIVFAAFRSSMLDFAAAALVGLTIATNIELHTWERWVVGVGAGCAFGCAAWLLSLARHSMSWPTGHVRVDALGPRLVTDRATYLLNEVPTRRMGELEVRVHEMTLPQLELDEVNVGPYRGGKPIGRVPHALPVNGRFLTSALVRRAFAHALFGISTIVLLVMR